MSCADIFYGAARLLFACAGKLVALCRRRSGPSLTVFAYHGITDREEVFQASGGLHLPRRDFVRHCESIAASFRPIGLDEFLTLPEHADPGPYALLTFDDGYDNIATNALPILEAHHLPFLIFLTTAYTGGVRHFWWDDVRLALLTVPYVKLDIGQRVVHLGSLFQREAAIAAVESDLAGMEEGEREAVVAGLRETAARYILQVFQQSLPEWVPLREESLRQLERHSLCQIGLHSHSHPDLTALSGDALRDEMARCQRWHRERWGIPCSNFCFPFGACNARVVEECRYAGFERGFLLDPYRPPRFTMQEQGKDFYLINRYGPRPNRTSVAVTDLRHDLFIRCCGIHRL